MALIATIGGSTSNSYQDRSEADLYFADRLYATAWTGASTADRDKALIMACARLEQEEYVGEKVTHTQSLKWPRIDRRNCSVNFALEDLNGNGYDSESIPRPVKNAQCEVAISILSSQLSVATGALGAAGLKSVELGPITLDFAGGSSGSSFGSLPEEATRYLRGLLITVARIVRG